MASNFARQNLKLQYATSGPEAERVSSAVLSSPTVGQVATQAVVTNFDELSTCETADSLRRTDSGLTTQCFCCRACYFSI